MPDRNTVVLHLQIMYIWASFMSEHPNNGFTEDMFESMVEWLGDALKLIKGGEVG